MNVKRKLNLLKSSRGVHYPFISKAKTVLFLSEICNNTYCSATQAIEVWSTFREVQLKSPNWLYGQRKVEGETSPKPHPGQGTDTHATKGGKNNKEFGDLDWLTTLSPDAEEELFAR